MLDPFFQCLNFLTICTVIIVFLFHPFYFIFKFTSHFFIVIYFIWDNLFKLFLFVGFLYDLPLISKIPRVFLSFFNRCSLLDLLWLIHIKMIRNWAFWFSFDLEFNGLRVWDFCPGLEGSLKFSRFFLKLIFL
jgi:hypothetical protein